VLPSRQHRDAEGYINTWYSNPNTATLRTRRTGAHRNPKGQLNLGMPVRRVLAHDAVTHLKGQVALERGPIFYCLEAVDNGGHALNLARNLYAISDGPRIAN
jgi:Glycoside hydrolase family 127 C-terminal domain